MNVNSAGIVQKPKKGSQRTARKPHIEYSVSKPKTELPFAALIRELGIKRGDEVDDQDHNDKIRGDIIDLGPVVLPSLYAAIANPTLVEPDSGRHRRLRIHAIRLLSRIAPISKDALPSLMVALSDADEGVKGDAASALGSIGPNALPAVRSLIQIVREDNASNCIHCANAIVALGEIGQLALPQLIKALHSKDPGFRKAMISAIGRIRPPTKEAVPILIKALKDPEVRGRAAQALANHAPVSEAAIPALVSLLGELHEAKLALTSLGAAAVPALEKALVAQSSRVRREAASALGEVGPIANDAVYLLRSRLSDEDPSVRYHAAVAIGKIGTQDQDVISDIVDLLKDAADTEPFTGSTVQCGAARSLGSLGVSAKFAAPILVRALKDDNRLARCCENALLDMGSVAISELIDALKDDSGNIRKRAANLLAWIGPPANAALPALNLLLSDPQAEVRKVASCAIEKITSSERVGLPCLSN